MMRRFALFTLLIVAGLALSACTNESSDMFSTTGTIMYLSFEGGFYGIQADNGNHYDPINLPEEYKIDGLRVRFEAKELTDRGSFHQWGRIVDIQHIEKL